MIALEYNERDRLNTVEIVFMVYALGFTLEKVAAMQEHGIQGINLKYSWDYFSDRCVSLFQRNLGKFYEVYALVVLIMCEEWF